MLNKLSDDCGLTLDFDEPAVTSKEIEFFAEQIVKECAKFLKDVMDDHFAAEQLVEHFGVE